MGEHQINSGNPTDGNASTLRILGVRVDNVDSRTALERVAEYASRVNGRGARNIYFTNVRSIMSARRDHELHAHLDHADLVLPDGSGLKIAGLLYRTPITENLNGTDFTPRVLGLATARDWTVYLLGAKPEILESCKRKLREMFPGIQIVGWHHGYFSGPDEREIIDDINRKKPNILLVGLGTPLQEKWTALHAPRLRAGACLAVGGLFDFLSGNKSRAPRWMRNLGIEWIFRFVQDPAGKWYRVFYETPAFLCLILFRRLFPGKRKPRQSNGASAQ